MSAYRCQNRRLKSPLWGWINEACFVRSHVWWYYESERFLLLTKDVTVWYIKCLLPIPLQMSEQEIEVVLDKSMVLFRYLHERKTCSPSHPPTDVRTGDWGGPRQKYGAFPLLARERRVRAILQAASCSQAAPQQEWIWRLREEHDLKAQGTCPFLSASHVWNVPPCTVYNEWLKKNAGIWEQWQWGW